LKSFLKNPKSTKNLAKLIKQRRRSNDDKKKILTKMVKMKIFHEEAYSGNLG
jgi:hypothetical protein